MLADALRIPHFYFADSSKSNYSNNAVYDVVMKHIPISQNFV